MRATPRVDTGISVALVVAAAVVRMGELGPSSLWLDDAWVGLVHRVEWGDLPEMGLTSPGFLFAMKAWFGVVGFSELNAQIPAFLAAVAGPAVMFTLLRSRTRRSVAAGAAVLFVFAPLHVDYSTHVKQYALEVVLELAILWAAFRVRERPECRRRWWTLCGLAVIGPLFSFVVVSVSAFAVAVSFEAVRRVPRDVLRTAVGVAALATLTPAVLYFSVVRANASPSLRVYWSAHYVDGSSPGAVVRSSAERIHDVMENLVALPAEITLVVLGVCFLALLWRRSALFAMTAGPLGLAYAMAVADYAPLGGGRTDIYLIPPMFVGAALGADVLLDELSRSRRLSRVSGRGVAAVVVGLVAVVAFARLDSRGYPQEDVRPLIALMESEREPGDVVLIYYRADFAFALYADVEFDVVDGTPYSVTFGDERIIAQASRQQDPAAQLKHAREADALGGRIWLIGTHFRSDWEEISTQIGRDLGREEVDRWTRDGAEMVLYAAR